MGRKHFMSVLGTGLYSDCAYRDAESGVVAEMTPFVQQAVFELKCGDFKAADRITIFVTEKAEKVNWTDRPYTEKELEILAKRKAAALPKSGDIRYGLGGRLMRGTGREIEPVRIPNGQTQDEIWELFETIVDQIGDGDEIIFDMTHGFRSLPILSAAVLHYAKVVKQVKVLGIYYGALLDNGAEIWNMTSYSKVMDWVEAAESFAKYGNSEHICELYREEEDNIKNIDMRFSEDLKRVIEGIRNLTEALRTSRGRYDNTGVFATNEKNSIQAAYEFYRAAAEKIDFETENSGILGLLRPLLQYIGSSIELFRKDNNLDIGLATVQWCIDKNLVVQGYAALEETINTYLCTAAGLDETDWKVRDGIVNQVLGALTKKSKIDKISVSNMSLEDIIGFICTELEMNEKIHNLIRVNGFTKICDIDIKLTEQRNDISHFGFEKSLNVDILKDSLSTLFYQFLNCLQEGNVVKKIESEKQKRIHIISSLGKQRYFRCRYSNGNHIEQEVSSEFALEAILKLKCKEHFDKDFRISVLVTEKALNENGSKLKASLPDCLAASVEFVIIEEGKTGDELWKIFQSIYDLFETGDEIYFDVTNGFRSVPLLFLPVLNYAAILKGISIKEIYYAAVSEEEGVEKKRGSVLELTPYTEIIEWASGADQFIRYGNCDKINDICAKYAKESKGKDLSRNSIIRMIRMFQVLTKTLNTCRGKWSNDKACKSKNSILEAHRLIMKEHDAMPAKAKGSIKPLKELLDKMEESVSVFQQNDNFGTGMAAISWYLDKHMVQQGFIALDETITTYICGLEGIDSNSSMRRRVSEKDENIPEALPELRRKVREFRNDLQHFGFSKESRNTDIFENNLKLLYWEFIEISGWTKQ